jgi:hypothetical protein
MLTGFIWHKIGNGVGSQHHFIETPCEAENFFNTRVTTLKFAVMTNVMETVAIRDDKHGVDRGC